MNFSLPFQQKLLLSGCITLFSALLHGQALQVTDAATAPFTPQNLITNILLGNGVEVTNLSFDGDPEAIGYFTGGMASIGLDRGIVLTTGQASSSGGNFGAEGVGNQQASVPTSSNANDDDLDDLTTAGTNDVAIYTITFVPTSDTLRFRYCFASEEYPEFSCSPYNDVFGFFIQGPGYPTPTNIAKIPGTNLPVTINNIHPTNVWNGQTCAPAYLQYYNNNNNSTSQPVYDGFTDVFTAEAIVVPCQQYTIKLAIADVSDNAYDSGVFLEAKSFGTGSLRVFASTSSSDGAVAEGCSPGSITFQLPNVATQDFPLDYNVWGTAIGGTDYSAIPLGLFIPAGQSTLVVPIEGFEDGIPENTEFLAVDIQRDPCTRDTIFISIRDNQMKAPDLISDTTVCTGAQAIELNATVPVTLPPPPVFTNSQDYSIAPVGTAITSPINVFGVQPTTLDTGVIRSICLNIDHSWDDDLDIYLVSPGGQVLELSTDNGQDGNNYTNTCFTPKATTKISAPGPVALAASAPFTGDWLPEGPFDDLWDGSYPTNGQWRLRVRDDAMGFSGNLLDWSITFEPRYKIQYQWLPTAGVACPTCPITTVAADQDRTYAVFATDSYGCIMMDSIRVKVAELETNVTTDNISCFGKNDGEATVNVTTSTGQLNYIWSSGAITPTATGLAAGTYSVVVADAGTGCAITTVATITEPPLLSLASMPDSVDCYGGNTGAALATSTGGTSPYTYIWSNGATTQNNTALSAGTYTVVVSDKNGCQASSAATVGQPTVFAASFNSSNATCNGLANGSTSVTLQGGVAPYQYLWSNGKTTASLTGLAAGDYLLTVTDANGCSIAQPFTLNEPPPIMATATADLVKCFGESTGKISLQYDGGTAPYTFLWSNGLTTADIGNQPAGTYSVTIRDNNTCTLTTFAEITQSTDIVLANTMTPVKCFDGNDGGLGLQVGGGNPGYTAQWTGPGFTGSGTALSNLHAGTYVTTVTDNFGCTATLSATVAQPPAALNAVLPLVSDTVCFNGSEGRATVVASGGTTPYTYLWDANGQTDATATGLSLSTYKVTVTDANNCTSTAFTFVNQQEELFAFAESQAPKCHNGSDGTASVLAVFYGANAADLTQFSYAWGTTPTQSSANATGLTALQTYTVTVTDAQGCTSVRSVTVDNQFELVPSIVDFEAVKCHGDATGSATATALGGVPPYSWQWSPSAGAQTTANAANLPAGVHFAYATDSAGCVSKTSVTIEEPALLRSDMVQFPVKCHGDATGAAQVTASGGVKPYAYAWEGGSTAPNAQNLPTGFIEVRITDGNGCLHVDSILVTQPNAPLAATATGKDPTCFGDRDGTVSIVGAGGTPPYRYALNDKPWNGSTLQIGLQAGAYEPKIIDANGCTARTDLVTLEQRDPLTVDLGPDIRIELGQDTQLLATPGNLAGAVTFVWSQDDATWLSCMDCSNPLVEGLQFQHDFTVLVRDSYGCTAEDRVRVDVDKPRRVHVPTAFTPNGDLTNDILLVHGQSTARALRFQVYDRWGELLYEGGDFPLNSPDQGWDGSFRGSPAAQGVYVWVLEVEYLDRVREVFKGQTTLIR
jgi:gliding motility-associated-like protein